MVISDKTLDSYLFINFNSKNLKWDMAFGSNYIFYISKLEVINNNIKKISKINFFFFYIYPQQSDDLIN